MKKRRKLVCTTYLDAVEVRSYNRRLVIEKKDDDQNMISFTRALMEDEDPQDTMTRNFIFRDKIMTSVVALSDEGIKTLHATLDIYLNLNKKP